MPYRHLVFTLPWELRLLIQDNRKVLLNVLFRAAADALLSLTMGQPYPRGSKSQQWVARKKKCKPYKPGFIIVLHTFGSDLKWNPHLHVIITAGGLRGDDRRWVMAPKRYLVPAPLLGTEWKLNVIAGIRQAHGKSPLYCRRLRSDARRRIKVDLLLGHVRKKRWHILIGPSLRSANGAVRYACRYTKRPVIAEGRITRFQKGYVTFHFKDYHAGGARSYKKLPVLVFIDRLVQHLPDQHFRQARHYGLLATATRTKDLVLARQLLAQRRKRRKRPTTWEQRRQAAGERKPLSCPQCEQTMAPWAHVFGGHSSLSALVGVPADQPIPPHTYVDRQALSLHHLSLHFVQPRHC